jgi:hypothetical protein
MQLAARSYRSHAAVAGRLKSLNEEKLEFRNILTLLAPRQRL